MYIGVGPDPEYTGIEGTRRTIIGIQNKLVRNVPPSKKEALQVELAKQMAALERKAAEYN